MGELLAACPLSIFQAADAEGVAVLESGGQGIAWDVLVADGAHEALDGAGADRSGAAIAGGGEGATMHDGMSDFDTGGEAVDDEATGLFFQKRQQVTVMIPFGAFDLQGGGELAFERVDNGSGF